MALRPMLNSHPMVRMSFGRYHAPSAAHAACTCTYAACAMHIIVWRLVLNVPNIQFVCMLCFARKATSSTLVGSGTKILEYD